MNKIQIANFVYWLQEYSDLRGVLKEGGHINKMKSIVRLQDQFLDKYPDGILTGFNKSSETIESNKKYEL